MWNVYRDANGNEYPVARPRNEDRTTLTEFDAVAGQPDQELLSPYAIRIYWRCMAPSTERMSPAQRFTVWDSRCRDKVFHAEVLVREPSRWMVPMYGPGGSTSRIVDANPLSSKPRRKWTAT